MKVEIFSRPVTHIELSTSVICLRGSPLLVYLLPGSSLLKPSANCYGMLSWGEGQTEKWLPFGDTIVLAVLALLWCSLLGHQWPNFYGKGRWRDMELNWDSIRFVASLWACLCKPLKNLPPSYTLLNWSAELQRLCPLKRWMIICLEWSGYFPILCPFR